MIAVARDNERARAIAKTWKSVPTVEGAGVRLKRVFGFDEANRLDPFLLLDAFRSNDPEDYRRGFPSHPHRGIETMTYILAGEVEHADSLGNRGRISAGEVQWMTAGRGIIHEEMPKGDRDGRVAGFQLWANLPASHKMMPPRYREVKRADIPEVRTATGAAVRVIAGTIGGVNGPVADIVTQPELFDVSLAPDSRFTHVSTPGHTVFAYVFEGEGFFEPDRTPAYDNDTLILYASGDRIVVRTKARPVRFLLAAGRPLGEPIAWYGPIVMNTEEEIAAALAELQRGTFVQR